MKINNVSPIDMASKLSKPVDAKVVDAKPVQSRVQEVKPDVIHHMDAKDEKPVDEDVLAESVKQANKSLAKYNRYIEREIHEVTHAVMYTLRDNETKEIIAEFPPKKIQDMIAKMWELAGLFVDEKA
jgi:uncharacterized FlaG/YvyC family protein